MTAAGSRPALPATATTPAPAPIAAPAEDAPQPRAAAAAPAPTVPDRTERCLDLRGLKCPLPALRTKRALAALAPGDVLIVLATDPLARLDVAHLCREDGHLLEHVESLGTFDRFTIRRAAADRRR